MKAYASYKLNEANSGLYELNAVDIQILSQDPYNEKILCSCQDILVYSEETLSKDGSTIDDVILSCHSKGFNLKEIIIRNKGAKTMDLDIQLIGVKKKIPVPLNLE